MRKAGLEPEEAGLRSLATDMAGWLLLSKSNNTIKKYNTYFKRFSNFAEAHDRSALPASHMFVALFCTYLLNCKKSPHILSSCIYSIKFMHNLYGYSDPTDCSHVKGLLEAAKRVGFCKPTSKKDPVTPDIIKDLFLMYSDSVDIAVLRDLSMIVLAYSGFLRYDELSNIRCNDLTFHDSYVNIHIRKSKTDQFRDGNDIVIARLDALACPVKCLKAYVEQACIDLCSSHYLFKAIFRSKNIAGLRVKNTKLSYTRTKEVLLAKLLEVSPPGIKLGLHSLRSGGASAAANSGVDSRCWRRHGRWRSDVANRYVKDSISSRLSVSMNLGL